MKRVSTVRSHGQAHLGRFPRPTGQVIPCMWPQCLAPRKPATRNWPLAASPPKRAALPPFSAAWRRCRNSGGSTLPDPSGPVRASPRRSGAIRPAANAGGGLGRLSRLEPGRDPVQPCHATRDPVQLSHATRDRSGTCQPTSADTRNSDLGRQGRDPALFSYSISQFPPFGRTGRGADISLSRVQEVATFASPDWSQVGIGADRQLDDG